MIAKRPQVSLTHLDSEGQAHMVDVTAKADTGRIAMAKGRITMRPETFQLLRAGQMQKGDALAVARIAGIMAAKETAHLIPLCHTLLLTGVDVEFALDEAGNSVEITATAKTAGKTGVEMEALTAVAVSALTIYDMCKAVDRGMRIQDIRLVHKSGGKSGTIDLES